MCKGLFKVKSERKIKGVDVISYFKQQSVLAKGVAVCFAIFILASCGKNTDDSMFQTSESAVNAYRTYLSDMRSMETLSTEHLIEAVNDWQTLRDSVFVRIAKDTADHIHAKYETTIQMLHDSLQTEFIRLANSTPKTFKDVLLIKERTSPYRQDAELSQAVAAAEPFFDSLDSIPLYRKTTKNIVSVYKTFLAPTLKSGINSKDDLLDFIRQAVPFIPCPSSGTCGCRPFCHYKWHGAMLPFGVPVGRGRQVLLPGCPDIFRQTYRPKNRPQCVGLQK